MPKATVWRNLTLPSRIALACGVIPLNQFVTADLPFRPTHPKILSARILLHEDDDRMRGSDFSSCLVTLALFMRRLPAATRRVDR